MLLKTSFDNIFVSDDNLVALQEENLSEETYKNKIDIVKILKSLVHENYIPKGYVSQNINLTKLQIPQLNEELTRFIPKPLENQWIYRLMNINSYSLTSEENHIQNFCYILTFPKLVQMCSVQIDINNYFIERIGLDQFNQKIDDNQIRLVTNYNIDIVSDKRNILILHDFYQHPLAILDFVNSFVGQNIVLPYMVDIITFSLQQPSINGLNSILNVMQTILQHLKVEEQGYDIISHGTSSALGIKLQQMTRSKSILILCSPVVKLEHNIYHDIRQQSFSLADRNLGCNFVLDEIQQHQNDFSILTELQMLSQLQQEGNESSSQSEIQRAARSQSFTIKLSDKETPSNKQTPIHRSRVCSENKVEKQKDMGLIYDLQRADLKSSCYLVNYKQSKQIREMHKTKSFFLNGKLDSFQINEKCFADSIVLINDILRYIFNESNGVGQKLLFILKQSTATNLKILSNISEFMEIHLQYLPISVSRKRFYQALYGLMCLCPLQNIENYIQLSEYLDRKFFVSLDLIGQYLNSTVQLFDHQKIVVLTGTHDCLMDRNQLGNLLFMQDSSPNVIVRSLFGVGHEFFTRGSSIIQRMITSLK